jgi:hypothetical protein
LCLYLRAFSCTIAAAPRTCEIESAAVAPDLITQQTVFRGAILARESEETVERLRRYRLTPALAAVLLLSTSLSIDSSDRVIAAEDVHAIDGDAGQACNGRCLNPHPNQFKTWYGERKGTWVQVYRQWADGCTHYQWFDTRTNTWDVDPRTNAPKISWTCCVH